MVALGLILLLIGLLVIEVVSVVHRRDAYHS